MKLLVLAVLAVVASAKGDYHDDVFHFSTVNRPVAVSPAYSQYYSQPSQYYGQYSAYASQPLSSAQYKPAVSTYVSQPAVSTYVSQPAVSYVSQPAVSYVSSAQYKPAVSTYVSQPAVGTYISQPAVSYVSSAQYKPAVSTYASKPAVSYVSSEYKPAVSTYVSQPAVSTYSQPAISTYSQYVAKPFTYYQQTPVLKEVVYQQPQPLYSQVSVPVSSYSALGSSHLSSYAPAYNGPQYRILKQVQEVDPSGPYRMHYATENGISASEEGTLTAAGPEGPAVAKHGSYSYTGPDGVQYTVNWVADENGYRASGAHLPQAPEVPVVEAQRSLNFASPQFFRSSFYKK